MDKNMALITAFVKKDVIVPRRHACAGRHAVKISRPPSPACRFFVTTTTHH